MRAIRLAAAVLAAGGVGATDVSKLPLTSTVVYGAADVPFYRVHANAACSAGEGEEERWRERGIYVVRAIAFPIRPLLGATA